MGEQRVDQRAFRVARRRVDDHAGRLVDDDQMRVLEADHQRDRLGRRRGLLRLGQSDQDPGAGGGALRRVAQGFAAALDPAVEDQLLQPGARQLRQLALQGAIEPDPGILGRNRDRDALLGDRFG